MAEIDRFQHYQLLKHPDGSKEVHADKEPASPAPANEEAGFDLRSTATGRLLRLVTALIALLLLGALGTLVLINWIGRKPAVYGPAVHQGAVSVNTKPAGTNVRFNGQTLGRTPLTAAPLPSGQQILELELPGYHTRPVKVLIKDGVINNLGLVPLVHQSAPEQTRVAEVGNAIKVPMAFAFKPAAEPADARPSRPVKASVTEPAVPTPSATPAPKVRAEHSSGSAQERWKAKKEDAERRRDQLDDEKDAAQHELKRRWNDD